MPVKIRKWVNIVLFFAVIVVNYLASTNKINKMSPGQISDSYPVLITPAGYVFSIWGLIYLLLLIFCIFQFLPKYEDSQPVKEIGIFFSLTCLENIGWIFAWHYKMFALSLLIMLAFLVTLIIIMIRLYRITPSMSLLEKRVFKLPFSVYLGWISVATIANISFVLVASNWTRFKISPDHWSVIILFVIMLLGITVLTLQNDRPYVWVFIWAVIGIAVKNVKMNPIITHTALIMLAFLLINILASYLKDIQKPQLETQQPIKHKMKKSKR